MTERLNTLEAKVRTCLYSPVWQKFPRVAAEKDVELAALGRCLSFCPQRGAHWGGGPAPGNESSAAVHMGIAHLWHPLRLHSAMQLHLCLPSSMLSQTCSC